jgi:hypothetical protein
MAAPVLVLVTTSSVLVQCQAKAARQVIWAGTPALLENRDLATAVYLGGDEGMDPAGNDVAILDPLGTKSFDGSADQWAMTQAGAAVVSSIPGATGSTPSAVAIATEIVTSGLALAIAQEVGATGVPLLTKSTNIDSQTAVPVAAGGGKVTRGPFLTNQVGYEIAISVQCNAGATSPFFEADLLWSDSVTGQNVAEEIWQMGMSSGAPQQFFGTGPTKGDTLTISFTNPDPVGPATFSYSINANSRVYTRDDWRQRTINTVPGFNQANYNQRGSILIGTAPSVPAGGSVIRIMPLYAGNVTVCLASQGQAGGVLIEPLDVLGGIPGVPLAAFNIVANGVATGQAALPRSPCLLIIQNTGGAAQLFSCIITINEASP